MKVVIIIPAHNEAQFISQSLLSLCRQTHLPHQIIVVNDGSTDATAQKVEAVQRDFPFVKLIENPSENAHLPGRKIINAFYAGFHSADVSNADVICKFDADLVFPPDYLSQMVQNYRQNKQMGMFGGVCVVQQGAVWQVEGLTSRTHLRGGLKSYRKECFEAIGGLKNAMGWDTLDELLARHRGYQVVVYSHLQVQHLRPTGALYEAKNAFMQGQMFYQVGYGLWLSLLGSAKLAWVKKDFSLLKGYLSGYFSAWKASLPKLVSEEEEKWIRQYRWENIRRKLGWL